MNKKIILLFFSFLLGAGFCQAQQVLIGGTTGEDYNNAYYGLASRLEVPIGSRFEIDGNASIGKESKSGYGTGYFYDFSPTGYVFPFREWGGNISIGKTSYFLNSISKQEYYSQCGITYRKDSPNIPIWWDLDYVWEIKNGISPDGTETNHLKGIENVFDFNIGCSKKLCYRFDISSEAGKFLNQGNPQCDGSYGIDTCPRSSSFGGGIGATFYLEFPKRK